MTRDKFDPLGPRIGIVSYCDYIRTTASLNHQSYADAHGYTYIYDIAPTRHARFKAKVEKIRKLLPLFDWVFWIDDDAYFMQRERPLREFIEASPDASAIFCASPVNEGNWTWISSGTFLLRNCAETIRLLDAVLDTDLAIVSEWWDAERLGLFTNGDQDAFVYHLLTDPVFNEGGFFSRLPYDEFNSRPFHFTNPDDHFIVHFTGAKKHAQASRFGRRLGLNSSLIQSSAARYVGCYVPRPGLRMVRDNVSAMRSFLRRLVRKSARTEGAETDV